MFGNIWIDSYVLIYSSYLMMYIVKLNTYHHANFVIFVISHSNVNKTRQMYLWLKQKDNFPKEMWSDAKDDSKRICANSTASALYPSRPYHRRMN